MNYSRRSILKASTVAALSSLAPLPLYSSSTPDKIKLGLIGCGGRSKGLVKDFRDHATFSWVCDPDQQRCQELQQLTGAEHVTSDLRKILEDSSVHAVVIATPDHWHAPATLLAAAAGKHVYVEKPCSHNYQEGLMLINAAQKNKVHIQHGTQSRSNKYIVKCIELLRDGIIGEVLAAKAWNIQRRENIGKLKAGDPPANVDYDTWVGPAEYMPFQSNRFHYSWHWWYNYGTGDIGNDGAHEMDIARWGLSVSGLPDTTMANGGKLYFDDDQQFPDTAVCSFRWNKPRPKQLLFDMRIWSTNPPYNVDSGVEFYGTEGLLMLSKRGIYQLWDKSRNLVELPDIAVKTKLSTSHQVNFLDAIRETAPLAADIKTGHDSVTLIHLANISLRTQQSINIHPESREIIANDEVNNLLKRKYRAEGHWGVPSVVKK